MDYLKLLKKYEKEIIGDEFVKETRHTARLDFAHWLNQQAAQQRIHPNTRCAGHEGGAIVKDCVCQTCGLYSPA